MADLSYPLVNNEIRRNKTNNAYGMVRNGNTTPHQGWDLIAPIGTPAFAVADGKISYAGPAGKLGTLVVLEFKLNGRTLYAAYAHLSVKFVRRGQDVTRGAMIGRTGTSGNASGMTGADQHLHFEIRTTENPPALGLGERMDPADVYLTTPMDSPIYDTKGKDFTVPTAR